MLENITAASTSAAVRRYLTDALKLDVIGPSDALGDPTERIPGWIKPSTWYLTGFLIPSLTPPEAAADGDEQEDFELVPDSTGDPGESVDDRKSKQKAYFPSSMGMSFLVDKSCDAVAVTIRWGDYHRVERKRQTEEDEEVDSTVDKEDVPDRSYWQRNPKEASVRVAFTGSADPSFHRVEGSTGLELHVVERKIETGALDLEIPSGTRSVSVFLVNHRPPDDTSPDTTFVFQAELEIESTLPFVPRINPRGSFKKGHPDELVADLHYANSPEFATGHAVSAEWKLVDGRCYSISTTWVPTAEVEKTETAKVSGVELNLDLLGELKDGAGVRAALQPLVDQYREWIEDQRSDFDNLTHSRRETAEELLRQAGLAAKRLQDGIDTLATDSDALDAFCVANRAVSRALKKRLQINEPRWRAFQLAFLLLNLPGIANPTDPNRETVDLLFFPTGGGKTEAYLGLAAFAMVLRRLRNPGDNGVAGAGVSIVMRYTLRLLTLDQLNRAAGLVCALELEREKDIARYGSWPFEIGLWVGKAATPNTMGSKGDGKSDTARTRVRQFKADPKGKPSPIPIDSCPWCGTKFAADSFQLLPNDDNPDHLKVTCPNFECDFTRGRALPIVAVDEPLYRRLPAFLIATVDKFASLPWVGPSGAVLGGATRYDSKGFYSGAEPGLGQRLQTPILPPDLIIQDELHLISGPLGTVMGLYESAIGALCRREISGKTVGPKIVASTATVRRAREQIQALFGRGLTQVFPPQGPNRRDSFFAQTVGADQTPARLYVGIAAQGRNPKAVMRKVWIALMSAAERAYISAGGRWNKSNPVDPYMTALGYFNSLRELGGGRRILEEEVQNTLKGYGSRIRLGDTESIFADRKSFSEVVELTSRVSTDKVAEARTRLGMPFYDKQRVDCAIATNMISVGLDIPRLGLMIVLGQPKTHSEYIQATSRVGRDDKKPGLVITLLNIHKPRDRSHYERFRHYHETFYRSVEVSSVTPFSARALDRAFPGVLVTLARHLEPAMTPPKGAEQIKKLRPQLEKELLDIFFKRVASMPFDSDDERSERKRSVQNRVVSLLDEWIKVLDEYQSLSVELQYQKYEMKTPQPLMHGMLEKAGPGIKWEFRVNRSMRDVEADVNLFLKDLSGKDVGGNE